MLAVEKLVVSYGRMQALRGVSLDVAEGEMIAIIGANGSGKTSLLNAISGLVPATAGRIVWQGQPVSGCSPDEVCRRGIIQVPEGRKLFAAMTVEENLLMGAYSPAARVKKVQSLEKVFSLFPRLAERRRQIAGSLSGGEQQMTAIGRGLMACPRLLMLDEPSLGLAPKAAAEIFETVRQLNAGGLTVVLVSQEVLENLSISQRGYVLENGAVSMQGPCRQLLADPGIMSSYLGL